MRRDAEQPSFEQWVGAHGDALVRVARLVGADEEAVVEALSRVVPGWRRRVRDDDPFAEVCSAVAGASYEAWAEVPEPDGSHARPDLAAAARQRARARSRRTVGWTGVAVAVVAALAAVGLTTGDDPAPPDPPRPTQVADRCPDTRATLVQAGEEHQVFPAPREPVTLRADAPVTLTATGSCAAQLQVFSRDSAVLASGGERGFGGRSRRAPLAPGEVVAATGSTLVVARLPARGYDFARILVTRGAGSPPPRASEAPERVPLPTARRRLAGDGEQSGGFGYLQVDYRGCLLVGRPGSAVGAPFVWPPGWTASLTDDGLVLLSAEGLVVAREDDAVTTSGSYRPVALARTGRHCLPARGEVFFVQGQVTSGPPSSG
ncbi:hypothetical protein BH11ACT8_BH11ACT8_29740 [soil metagenome]